VYQTTVKLSTIRQEFTYSFITNKPDRLKILGSHISMCSDMELRDMTTFSLISEYQYIGVSFSFQ